MVNSNLGAVNRKVQRWFGMVRYECVRVGGECKV